MWADAFRDRVHVGAAARETSLPVQDGARRGHGDADEVALWRNLAASRARSHRMAQEETSLSQLMAR